jgi:hypothetical protein
MGFGPDGKKLNASINKDGAITGTNINIADKVIVNDNITIPNGKMRLSNQGIMFGGPNTDREVNSGQITAGLHIANSLNIVGMSANKGADTRRIDMWAEGGLNIYGNINTNGALKIGNTNLTEDILKRIINQQQYAGFAIDGEGSTMPLFEGSYNLHGDARYGDAQFNAWTNDRWDVIYINRGWRITLWHHEIGNDKAAVGENKNSYVPKKLDIPNNKVSSYKAEWIGY